MLMERFKKIVNKNKSFVEAYFGKEAVYNPPSLAHPYGNILCVKCNVHVKLRSHRILEGFSRKKGLEKIQFVKKHIIKQECPYFFDFMDEKQTMGYLKN
jgi:hypothetical protein